MSFDLNTLTKDALLVLLDDIRREIAKRGERQDIWVRCARCNGTGKHSGGYCICQLGRDLRRIEVGNDSGTSYDAVPPQGDF